MSKSVRKTLLGVKIDDCSMSEALSISETWLRQGGFHQVATVGPEFILEAQHNPKFRDILNRSDLSLPEGMGIKIGFMLSGYRHRHRVPGVEYVHGILSIAARQHRSVFLFGAAPGVAEQTASVILEKYPGIQIAGVDCGSRWPWTPLADHRLVSRINQAHPDILLVALGAPKQEIWIDRHRHQLSDVRVAVGVGRTFDYLAGITPRAPAVMRRFGFEWLHTWWFAGRFHEPQRRRQRVENAFFSFLKAVLTQ